ncbi:MAG: methyltransferase [Candidatus Cloacimonadota bacterium]|nr:methyltransferase [Candidatus Cloacimonadota bacterium]
MKDKVLLPFGKTILQSGSGQGISEDTSALIEQILNNNNNTNKDVLELGSGNGIISIMLAYYRPNWKITGIEIQPHLVELSLQNLHTSEVQANFLKEDLCTYKNSSKFDIIVSNPPFFPLHKVRISPNREKAIARSEVKCNLEEVLKNLHRNLRKEGKAYLIYPTLRQKKLEKMCKIVDLKVIERIYIQQMKKIIFILEWK